MDGHSFEIFKKGSASEPIWLDTYPSLESAIGRIREIFPSHPNEYFIFDRCTRQVISVPPDQLAEPLVRILVADDHEDSRRIVCKVLEGRGGFRIVGQAGNGKEAIVEAEMLQPDIVIMDVTMPELDGLKAAQVIKRSCPKTSILVLSVHTGGYLHDLTKSLGFDGYVTKGGDYKSLIAAVGQLVHKHKYFRQQL